MAKAPGNDGITLFIRHDESEKIFICSMARFCTVMPYQRRSLIRLTLKYSRGINCNPTDYTNVSCDSLSYTLIINFPLKFFFISDVGRLF